MNKFIDAFKHTFKSEQLLLDEPMKKHTTFKIGGAAELLFVPESRTDVITAVRICQSDGIPFFIMGNGSNLLVSDEGFRGVIVKIDRLYRPVSFLGDGLVEADAGVSLAALASAALREGLGGFEFASGIPGTLGGAVYMNAGAYDGEIKNVLVQADLLTPDGRVITEPAGNLELGYRTSRVQRDGSVILSAVLKLNPAERDAIRSKMDDLNCRRRDVQPLDVPSAGSTFRRPPGFYAGKLIMDSGLSGYTVGGAQVSPKHCGFIVNKGEATASDVVSLIEHVRKTVFDRFGVSLTPEVKIL